jgi:hypothetical protein
MDNYESGAGTGRVNYTRTHVRAMGIGNSN